MIRVAPNELSIYDIDAYLSEIYAQNTKFTKAPYFYDAFNNPHGTVFSQRDKGAHSAEKRLMSHAFSRRNIVGMQHELYGHVHKWVEKLRAHVSAGKPIPLSRAAQCLTLDNVSFFSYGSDEGALDSEDFQSELLDQFDAFPKLVTAFQYLPFLQSIANILQHFSMSSSSAARVTQVSFKTGFADPIASQWADRSASPPTLGLHNRLGSIHQAEVTRRNKRDDPLREHA